MGKGLDEKRVDASIDSDTVKTISRKADEAVLPSAFMADNPVVHFGNYLGKIGQSIALDFGETKDWVAKKLSGHNSDDEDEALGGATSDCPDAVRSAALGKAAAANNAESTVAAPKKKKVLILMSDTGGGHRASANAIKAALLTLEPEQELEVKIVDVLEDYTLWFSNRLYTWYVTYPVIWETIYNTTKKAAGTSYWTDPSKFLEPTVRPGFRRCIAAEQPDLVISVHPILQCIPLANFMPAKPPRPIPFLTCVTDLGDGHPWWFNAGADRIFVATDALKQQAIQKGIAAERVQVIGLPLRTGFWNVDCSDANKKKTRDALRVGHDERKVVLVMGGGDGMGKLEAITQTLPAHLVRADYKSVIVVVCGRNAVLEKKLLENSWPAGCTLDIDTHTLDTTTNPSSHTSSVKDTDASVDSSQTGGAQLSDSKLLVRVLGFVANIEDYMLAAHVLVSKAGPGSIAEAAACALPVMLYDFLPGQEEANIHFVRTHEMGEYEEEVEGGAERVARWLGDEQELRKMSLAAKAASKPTAARDIAEHTMSILNEALAVPLRTPRTARDASRVAGVV